MNEPIESTCPCCQSKRKIVGALIKPLEGCFEEQVDNMEDSYG